jgi:2-iminobutanoate/2-iminopropanoate deaminase
VSQEGKSCIFDYGKGDYQIKILTILTSLLLGIFITFTMAAKEPNHRPNLSISKDVEYLTSTETTSLNLPFSEAVRVGNMLYLSGVIGNIPGKKELVPGGIKAETKQTMENIKRFLERYNSSLEQIVKCQVMLADIKEWAAMNEVYVTYFAKDRLPARSGMGINALALDARVEIECMATIK